MQLLYPGQRRAAARMAGPSQRAVALQWLPGPGLGGVAGPPRLPMQPIPSGSPGASHSGGPTRGCLGPRAGGPPSPSAVGRVGGRSGRAKLERADPPPCVGPAASADDASGLSGRPRLGPAHFGRREASSADSDDQADTGWRARNSRRPGSIVPYCSLRWIAGPPRAKGVVRRRTPPGGGPGFTH